MQQRMPGRLQLVTADVLSIQDHCSGKRLLDSLAPPPISLRTRRIGAISKPSFFVQRPGSSQASAEEVGVVKCICLPLREDTHVLLDKFIQDVLHFHHIFHSPSLPFLVERLYDAVDRGEDVDIGQLVLMLAICCSSTYTWTRYDDDRGLFGRAEDANSQAAGWLTTALDTIHDAHLAAHTSMACIQGMIVVYFIMCSLEGISARTRLLHAQTIAMAHVMGLHSIDAPNANANANPIRQSTVQAEVGRRIWWHLADTDWMLSRLSLPQQGSYLILPFQMAVRKPCNTNDEDIVDGCEIVDRPLEEATSVSYLLQRIRLAELLFDLGWHGKSANSTSEEAEYLGVMEADMKLRQFMRELPSFFRLENSATLSTLPGSDIRRSSNITIQRYTLNMIFHGQICKIHLPFLAKGTIHPGFAYSHDSCLTATQRIICIEHQLRADISTFTLLRQRMNIKFRSIFIACVVLVLDGCLASSAEGGAKGSNATIADAWEILHDAKDQSPVASELLQLSIQILQKHKATHPALEMMKRENYNKRAAPAGENGPTDAEPIRGSSWPNDAELWPSEAERESAGLGMLWQTIQGRGREWNDFFWGLGPPLM
ncbi:hypothetical protein Trco_008301 [Trichoderma cornu-damae]|uniref:Transcription factor domain-containing protein n=1 Tax=Trichoderma cornu-damae TaxID=654480 RepID=A0A9P8QFC9_9HYPO|nr:hypothetical protein Trco_008301 [Trichoderma cornu-damae]